MPMYDIPRRHPHWEPRLADWAQAMLGRPFVWGENDCFLLALGAIDAMSGTPDADGLAAAWRGRWHDRASSIRYMLKHRTHALKEFEAIGLVPVDARFRQPGDIIVIDAEPDDEAAAKLRKRIGVGYLLTHVCLGRNSLCAHPDTGILVQPTAALIAAGGGGTTVLRLETACRR